MTRSCHHHGEPNQPRNKICVVSFGNLYRCDDGLGEHLVSEVVQMRPHVHTEVLDDPLGLLGVWDGADLVVLIDAMRSGAQPGSVEIVELADLNFTLAPRSSTHGLGLRETYGLARILGREPRRVVVVAIEGAHYGDGVGLSQPVLHALPHALAHILDLIDEYAKCA